MQLKFEQILAPNPIKFDQYILDSYKEKSKESFV
jgi:hypothetical protein